MTKTPSIAAKTPSRLPVLPLLRWPSPMRNELRSGFAGSGDVDMYCERSYVKVKSLPKSVLRRANPENNGSIPGSLRGRIISRVAERLRAARFLLTHPRVAGAVRREHRRIAIVTVLFFI